MGPLRSALSRNVEARSIEKNARWPGDKTKRAFDHDTNADTPPSLTSLGLTRINAAAVFEIADRTISASRHVPKMVKLIAKNGEMPRICGCLAGSSAGGKKMRVLNEHQRLWH
jgi:hypothetical protein